MCWDGDAAELDAAEESYSSNAGGPENSASIVETLENMLEKAQALNQIAKTKSEICISDQFRFLFFTRSFFNFASMGWIRSGFALLNALSKSRFRQFRTF